MHYSVTFYCPDTHIQYDGRTPYTKGVGGGITARIRMARALARAGHRVTMVVNCAKKARIDDGAYRPLEDVKQIQGDVLIMNTSGGPLDLSPILQLDVDVGLKAVWTSGTPRPGGLDEVGYDFVYAKSNFLRQVAYEEWSVPEAKIFVAYNGFEEADFKRAGKSSVQRDPYRLVYFSHPSKGLETSLDVLHRLRSVDSRFHLVVFGGNQLWGQQESIMPSDPGLDYRGLVGQKELVRELFGCSYSMNLQARLEPFGMVITESMRAGCVVIASPVGAYAELVRDGEDGFLIQGDHESVDVREEAAKLILKLAQNPDATDYIQRNAFNVIWDTDTMVRVWEGHWRWWFGGQSSEEVVLDPCPACGSHRLWLADGYHCTGCGRYFRRRGGGSVA
jgi:glycosyltransferase involved in cell wall biosynthesis